MDREKVKALRDKMQEALDAFVGSDNGVVVKVGHASFSDSSVTFKVDVSEIVNGQVVTKEASAFKAMACLYGLKPEDLGRTFAFRGEKYTVSGLNPKAAKYPICGKRVSDGKGFKFGERMVAVALGYAPKPGFTTSLADSAEAEVA
jgi:hypothetical protein